VLWRNAAGQAGFVLAALVTSGVVVNLLKWGLGRARPSLSDGSAPFDFAPIATSAGWASFPSGHATTIVAMAAAVGFLWPRHRLIFLSLAVWVAASRVMVGAHWASDVVAGIALGAATAYALRLWYARRGRIFVLRGNRLRARTASLEPLMRREIARARDWLAAEAGMLPARLRGLPASGGPDARD
jgi:membrane-associated phospholipid phosphatase